MFSKLKNLFTAQPSAGPKSNPETLSTRIDTLLAQGQLSEAFEVQRSAAIALLAQNRFKEALELLQHESPDWQSLFQRYMLLQHNQRMGMMAAQDYAQSLEEIQQRVMRLMGPMETSPADKAPALGFVRPTQEEWARAAAELEAGNWQEAITLGQRWDTSWLLLFSRLQRTTRDRQLGVATAADMAEELDRIKWSFESLWAEEAKKWAAG